MQLSSSFVLDFLIDRMRGGCTFEQTIQLFIKEEEQKTKKDLSNEDKKLIVEAFKMQSKNWPNFDTACNIQRCLLVENISDRSNLYMFEPRTRTLEKLDRLALSTIFKSKVVDKIMETKLHTVFFDYDPTSNKQFFTLPNGFKALNQYIPANWLKDNFFDGEPLEVVTEMPPIYKDFFTYFVGGHAESYNYLVNWLAATVQPSGKPLAYLCAIGMQGVGKGTLGTIMKLLVGDRNYTKIEMQKASNSTFNGTFENKRVIFIDELSINKSETENYLKPFINDTIVIEKKGVDMTEVKNHSALYLASNYRNCLNIEASDRRYAVLNLAEISLKEYVQSKGMKDVYAEYVAHLLDEKNIRQLGLYLYQYKVDKVLADTALNTELKDSIREDSQKDWEYMILNEYCPENAGKEIPVSEATEWVRSNTSMKNVSRNMWKDLALNHRKRLSYVTKQVKLDNGQTKRVPTLVFNKEQL